MGVVKIGILSYLPTKFHSEIKRIAGSRRREVSDISELRIRLFGKSSAVIAGERIGIMSSVSEEDMKRIFSLLHLSENYIQRDRLGEGFISLPEGIRVGAVGCVGYDGGKLIGVSDFTSFIFRIPTGESDVAEELCEAFSECKKGMLIYSPPGVGKTSALRSLAFRLGARGNLQISVIDERNEFSREGFVGKSIDHFRGYKRDRGMEIALRCASPDVIIVDEIGSFEDSEAIMKTALSGVILIATAHAESYHDLLRRRYIANLIEIGAFDVFCGLSIEGGKRVIDIKGCKK